MCASINDYEIKIRTLEKEIRSMKGFEKELETELKANQIKLSNIFGFCKMRRKEKIEEEIEDTQYSLDVCREQIQEIETELQRCKEILENIKSNRRVCTSYGGSATYTGSKTNDPGLNTYMTIHGTNDFVYYRDGKYVDKNGNNVPLTEID